MDVSIWIPRINDSEELFNIDTDPTFITKTVGFGITPSAGFFGGWIALDMNFTWTDVESTDEPVFAFIFDPRIGKTFDLRGEDKNVSFWVGGTRLYIRRNSNGSVALNEVLDTDAWGEKVASGQEKVGDAQVELDDWWDSLSPIEQKNPINIAKREKNQFLLNLAGNVLNSAEQAINTADQSTLQFSIDKRQKSLWNFMVGSQYQFNKHWMVRAEYGFLSSRQHFIGSIQYRFGF